MADSFYTLQLGLPCTLTEASNWWEEVRRVMGDARDGDSEAGLSVIAHTDGTYRLTVHLQEEVT